MHSTRRARRGRAHRQEGGGEGGREGGRERGRDGGNEGLEVQCRDCTPDSRGTCQAGDVSSGSSARGGR